MMAYALNQRCPLVYRRHACGCLAIDCGEWWFTGAWDVCGDHLDALAFGPTWSGDVPAEPAPGAASG